MLKRVSWFRVVTILSVALAASSSGPADAAGGYRKDAIVDARYGTFELEHLLKRSYSLSSDLNKVVFGQEAATSILQAKLIQYFEGFPNRTGEPVAMNMIGLPGIGKSEIIDYLRRQGFPVVVLDAQDYTGEDGGKKLQDSIQESMRDRGVLTYSNDSKPVIIVIEEVDKVGEKSANGKGESTSSPIAILNRILSEGRMQIGSGTHSMSNVMVITTMNFSPNDIETFSIDFLGERKSYYDFTIEDFVKFDEWVRNQPSSRYKVLAQLFRWNTGSRFGPITTILQPLSLETYRRIVDLQVKRAVSNLVEHQSAAKRVTVDVHPSVSDFLMKHSVYAPSGARETVALTNSLVTQLINTGVKADGIFADRPRHLEIRYHPENDRIYIRATEMISKTQTKDLREGRSIVIEAKYDIGSRVFQMSVPIRYEKPILPGAAERAARSKRVTKKEMFENRFPKSRERTKGLRQNIGEEIFGQTEFIDTLVTDLETYFGRKGPATKEPSQRAAAGFPGNGKSEIFKLAAEMTQLPMVRINMQSYTSDSPETVEKFLADLHQGVEMAIDMARDQSDDRRFILLFEELDKVFELAPDGAVVNRPIMAIVKDLLNHGRYEFKGADGGISVDVRGAFIGMTMNFAIDRFGFHADPRLTSIEDVARASKKLRMTPSAIKEVLGSMFLPDTVSRLMTFLSVVKPLDRAAYQKIIDSQAKRVVQDRLMDEKNRNVYQVEPKTTAAYRRYMFSESVIPSEGARNTTKNSNMILASDLDYALAQIPRSSKYARSPLAITFDYNESRQVVRIKAEIMNDPQMQPLWLKDRKVVLKFPPMKTRGRISEERMHASAHEFGHAFTAVRMGSRFEHIVVVPVPGAGGYVKPNGKGDSAADYLAKLRMLLGSRAFERIVMSENPFVSESVLSITSGPSEDIRMATQLLYRMIYELGMDPEGGTLDRSFKRDMQKYASYEEMPHSLAKKMGLILRDIEDQIVRESLSEHPRDWYVEKIITLAKTGAMTEAEFYSLVERVQPSDNRMSVAASNAYFRSLFKKALLPLSSKDRQAAADRKGSSGQTPAENLSAAMRAFRDTLRLRLDEESTTSGVRSCRDLFIAI